MVFSHTLFRSVDGRFTNLLVSCTAQTLEATLIYYEHHQPTEILMHTQRPLSLSQTGGAQAVYDQTITELAALCEDVAMRSRALFAQSDLLADHQQIHEVTFFVGAPWTEKRWYNRSRTWPRPAVIRTEELDEFLDEDIPQGLIRLDTHLSRVAINGYIIDPEQLTQQRGISLDVSVLDIFMRVDLAETLFQVMHSHLNIAEEQFHLLPITSALVSHIERSFAPRTDHLQLFVYGRYSDVVVWQKGRILRSGSVPYGSQSLVSALEKSPGVSSETQAVSLLEMFTQHHLNTEMTQGIERLGREELRRLEKDILGLEVQEEQEASDDLPRDWYVFTSRSEGRYLLPLLKQLNQARVVDIRPRELPEHVGVINAEQPSSLTLLLLDFVSHYMKGKVVR